MEIARRVLKLIRFTEVFKPGFDYRCWISPYGKVIEVRSHHFEAIKENPTLFGYDEEEIKSYERSGSKGSSREDLIIDAVNKGWIRVRYYAKRDLWSVNIFRPSKRIADILTTFFERRYGDKKAYSEVKIDSTLGVINTSVDEIVGLQLFKQMESKKKKK